MPWTKATSACVKSCVGAEAACAGTRALIRPAHANATASRGAAEKRLESDIVAHGLCGRARLTSSAPADCTDNTSRALCERVFARIRRAEDSANCSARFCAEPGSAGIDDKDFRDKASRKTSTIDPHARIARRFERGPRMAELPRSMKHGLNGNSADWTDHSAAMAASSRGVQ